MSDTLREALLRLGVETWDRLIHLLPNQPGEAPSVLLDALHAAALLGATPDVERLAKAIDAAERKGGNYRDMRRHRWLAAAVAEEYGDPGGETP
jgi:hypothetical protein